MDFVVTPPENKKAQLQKTETNWFMLLPGSYIHYLSCFQPLQGGSAIYKSLDGTTLATSYLATK